MTNALLAVKDVFYDLIEPEQFNEDTSVSANQQMALQVTKGLQEKGVVIIQNQTQFVSKKVSQLAIKGMRIIDEMLLNGSETITLKEGPKNLQVKSIPKALGTGNLVEECANFFVDSDMKWAEAYFMLQKAFVKSSINKYGKRKLAADKIGLSYGSINKILREDNTVYIDSAE